MIKKLLLTVCTALCCSFLYGKQDWKLVWNDEFDYSGTPDNSKWSFDTEGNNWDWGNNEAQNYTPAENKNAWVEDGNLIIEARKESYRWYGDGQTKEYTSARLITKGKGDWLYGKVEVKALLPTGKGMWPAIWLLSTDDTYGGWPNSGELDIMENVGHDPNKIHCNIHTEAYNHKNGTNKGNTVTTSSPSQNWHIYSMEWDAEKVIFFLDGIQVFRFDNEHKSYKEWPYDKRFHLLLNIAVGGSWGGEQGIDNGIFPQKMLVDYVRVYQYGEVEDDPVDGVLKLNTSIAENSCSGENLEIAIDTTGTGKLLQPDKFEIKVSEYYKNSNSSNDLDMSKATVDENGLIKLYIEPKEDITITTQIKYLNQSIDTIIPVKVYPRPVIASVDSIGPKDVKVVLEDYDYSPYLFALDRGPFGEKDEFHNLDARDYVVSVKDANGCTAQTRFTINEPTAVKLIAGANISVFPIGNNIIVSGAEAGASFRVVDANGISVTEGKLSVDGIVNTSSLAKGIYYVIIDSNAYPIIKR